MVLAAILLTWIVMGAAFYWLGSARAVVEDLSAAQVPKLAQTARLSAKTADLAMLSNRILSGSARAPGALDTMLASSVAELSRFVGEGLGGAITRQDAEALQQHLAHVMRSVETVAQIETRILAQIDQLRWLNADIQDETAAVMADFAFNIEVLTRRMIDEADPGLRGEMASIPAPKDEDADTNKDAYSVLGRFQVRYGNPFSAGDNRGLHLHQFFATGMAAREAANNPEMQQVFGSSAGEVGTGREEDAR